MSKQLFLAWQNPDSRQWFPVGLLEREDNNEFVFRYTNGANLAEEYGFETLLSFPDKLKEYRAQSLFPLFENRIMSEKRSDFLTWIESMSLSRENYDPLDTLIITGGLCNTDSLEVFPKIESDQNGNFRVRFYMHGIRHAHSSARAEIQRLQPGVELQVLVELNNPTGGKAIMFCTSTYSHLGWAPRYLVEDLTKIISEKSVISAKVVRVNPTAPTSSMLLIELEGKSPAGYQFMNSKEFEPLC